MGELRSSEVVSLVYFVLLACLAWVAPAPRAARYGVTALALGVWAVTVVAAHGFAGAVRDWLPLGFLLFAYWSPGSLVTRVNERLERWLVEIDARIFSSFAGRAALRAPRPVREALELTYAAVYPLVPASLVLILAGGFGEDVDRFWTTVLVAEYACYGALPLTATRPPRMIGNGGPVGDSAVRRFNMRVLDGASNGWNTFPSGHVAGSLACALAVAAVLPGAGAVLIGLALLIAVASVAGRYHYAADAVAGAGVAVLVFVIVWL